MGDAVARSVSGSGIEGWDALLEADPNATGAHRPELWAALAGGRAGDAVRFLAVERDGRLVGGAGLVIERRAGLAWLHALPSLLPGTPLAAPGRHAEVDAAVGGALAALQRALGAAGGEWALYRPAGPEVRPAALAAASGETRVLETGLIDLEGGLDAAWRRVDRKTRQDIQRARRAGVTFAEDPGALPEAWALHLSQARAWRGNRPPPLELSRRLLAPAGAPGPLARLFTVRDRRGLLAATLALDGGRETMPWWSGSHRDARARGVMALLFWSVAEWAAAAGRTRVNLGASTGLDAVAAFKRALGARGCRYPVRWLDASHAPRPARWVAALQSRVRRGRARGERA